MTDTDLIVSDEFKARVAAFKKDFYAKYKKISKEKTPQVDGAGRKIIEKRPDGLDYVPEAFMRDRLNLHFPGWSWLYTSPLHFLGSEWVVAEGELAITDEHLLAFGVNPPIRKFRACGAARIQFKRGELHTPENVIDVDKNVKAANSNALKKAINQLCGICDDVYGKRIEEEGMGSFESLASKDSTAFASWIQNTLRIPFSKAYEILEVKSMSEITNFKEAQEKLKKAING